MKKSEYSLRQILVLTLTGFLAPVADLLPGLLARQSGRGGWLVPLAMLPVLVLWVLFLGRLFREEGSGLFALVHRRLGRVFGGALTLLYIMWGIGLLAEQLNRSVARMGVVYGGRGGEAMAAAVLLLAVWVTRGKEGALFRAGELLWLAAAVGTVCVLLLALPRIRVEYLAPEPGWMAGGIDYLNVWGGTVLGTALLARVPRKTGTTRAAVGWVMAAGLCAFGLTAVVLGQTGAGLAARLEHPFLTVVQGITLEGALARLEGPVAALWLVADFCRMGLLLAVLREAGGERWGRWLVRLGSLLAGGAQFYPLEGEVGVPWGLLLGFLVPACLCLGEILARKGGGDSTYCGGEVGKNHRYCNAQKRSKKAKKT